KKADPAKDSTKSRIKSSAVLVISLSQPTQDFGIHLVSRGKCNFKHHVLEKLRGSQAFSRLLAVKPQKNINAFFSCGLHARKCSSRCHKRHIALARLDDDSAKCASRVHDSIQDRSQPRPIRVLRLNQLVG